MEIAEILESDSEAFTRRSAATYLHRFYSNNTGHRTDDLLQFVVEKMVARIHDFDWEVKMEVIGFLEQLIDVELNTVEENSIPEYARNLQPVVESKPMPKNGFQPMVKGIRKCCDLGCFQAVFIATEDYDRKVVERAADLIGKLKAKIISSCKKMGSSDMDFIGYLQEPQNNYKEAELKCGISKSVDPVSDTDAKLVQCIKTILDFDISKYKLSDKNEYTLNPLSVIQDILSYGHKSEDDNVVDCY